MPNASSSQPPDAGRAGRATRNSATPPTTGGSTSGTVTSARSSDAPAEVAERASTQASGTPSTTRQQRGEAWRETSDSRSASTDAGRG